MKTLARTSLLAMGLVILGYIAYIELSVTKTRWRLTTSMPEPSALDVSKTMPDGEILFGHDIDLSGDITLHEFNPKSNTWTSILDKLIKNNDGSYTDAGRPSGLLPQVNFQCLHNTNLWSQMSMIGSSNGAYYGGFLVTVGNDAAAVPEPLILPSGDLFYFVWKFQRLDSATHKAKPMTRDCSGALLNIVVLHDNRILVVHYNGGSTIDESIYDPAADSWVSLHDPAPGVGQTMTLLPDGKVLAIGGAYIEPNTIMENLTALWNGLRYRFGGVLPFPTVHPREYKMVQTCRLFDPKTNSWSITEPLNIPRAFHTANLLSDGRVLVTGGYIEPIDIATKPSAMTATCEIINLKEVDP